MAEAQDAAAALAAQLALLREQFLQRLDGTLAAIAAQLAQPADDPGAPLPAAVLRDIHAQLHRLVGSGGTFGFAELSRQARTLEVQAQAWLDPQATPTPQAWAAWKAGVLGLRQAADSAAVAAPADGVPVVRQGPEGQPRVLLLHADSQLGASLRRGLGQFGYEVVYCQDLEQARHSLAVDLPDVMVLPIDGAAPDAPGLHPHLQVPGRRVPVIYLAGGADAALRLAAARAGGDDFLTLPLDAPTLAEHIARLLEVRRQPPYRVLIVDDDEMLAERSQLTLQAAGMLAERVSAPLQVIPLLQDFRPDVLLMDLHMPGHSGAELARAIRYDEAWQSLPILFLSAESDLDRQYEALGSGGDDFLCKPLGDAQLVAAVHARALRARKVAELMSQDSLTGLLKHASIKERLAQELERASRQGQPLAVAMVDIDLFKQVNDRWGHPTGDQVIKTLGHLLRQRVRRQDSVGRYGGEEFLVLLPQCSEADAWRLLDDIRQRFSAVAFTGAGQSFSGTLSAGVAASDVHHTVGELLAAADAALYRAKHGGRNQVVPATGPEGRAA